MKLRTFHALATPANFGVAALILIFCLLAALPWAWRDNAEDTLLDLQFRLRGERPLSDKIVLVYLGAEDIQALGGWPITRDYYGYLMHGLSRAHAQVVGFDILFDRADRHYPEFDAILADFFKSAGNVCLPLAFAELTNAPPSDSKALQKIMRGLDPLVPTKELQASAAGMGFSNFGANAIVRKAPLVLRHNDSLYYSFGFELARLYLNSEKSSVQYSAKEIAMIDAAGERHVFPIDETGRLRLNHFGGIHDVAAFSFVQLLQAFNASPDSLDFTGKIVIVAVTAPGAPILKATPLSEALPAALIHATVAENLITRNFLRSTPLLLQFVFLAVMVIAAFWIGRVKHVSTLLALSAAVLAVYGVRAAILFRTANLVVPVILPTLAYVTALAWVLVRRRHEERTHGAALRTLLQEQITTKENQLAEAQARLHELQEQLRHEAAASGQTLQLAEARKALILELEKQLCDLQSYGSSEQPALAAHATDIIHAADSKMKHVLELVAQVAPENIPVLLMGETGSGKELVAAAIHRSGARRHAAFVAVNCSALPETLLESELFGHEKGSFTGAQSRRRGRFELAEGGTIFLDEITETSPALQAKLLRVLQDGTFERLGSEHTLHTNVRIIAACNKNLPAEVEKGNFRADLFYRLNGFPITLPPLRERKEDIPLLAAHFLSKHGYEKVRGFSEAAMTALQAYAWPGNVRELENLVRRAAILAQSAGRNLIQASDLPQDLFAQNAAAAPALIYKPLESQILEMLRTFRFSRSAISQTAKALGNRDRGTITEYFRGICFEHLVQAGFDVTQAAAAIAASEDAQTIARVRAKIDEYLKNLDASSLEKLSKGLPQKYHVFLQQVNTHIRRTAQPERAGAKEIIPTDRKTQRT
ncbi:sigma 54-interacting transcriptional regulator [bacterium]|nr:sigma 54-interacting transcriptional regulator [bacterium]